MVTGFARRNFLKINTNAFARVQQTALLECEVEGSPLSAGNFEKCFKLGKQNVFMDVTSQNVAMTTKFN